MKTSILWRAGVVSDPGLQRDTNEDRVFVDEDAGVFLVVDGIGGQAAGEKAAELAVEVISNRLCAADGPSEQCVREAIAAANNEIFHVAQSNDEWRGMACVLTLALAREDRVTVGHVGDSRLYLAWDGKLRKLTSDHSPVGEREDQGELTEWEAMRHPRRHQVFRDVGSQLREPGDEDFIEIRSFPFYPDAALLLCSDGLSDMVPSSEIGAIVESYDGDPEKVSRQLVEAANRGGGKDNVSVVFVAGPEFPAARARHTITRVRRNSRWRGFLSRLLWLAAGVALGIGLWYAAPEWLPLPTVAHRAIVVNANDPQAIVKALRAARPGDTIEVPAGEFYGPLELKDGVSVIAEKPGAVILRADPAAVTDAGIAISARDLHQGRISGFRIIGDEKSLLTTGLSLENSAIEVDDLEISGATGCGVRMDSSSAILRANFIHDNLGCGVWIGGKSSPRLTGNRISSNGGQSRPGIEVHAPAAPWIENNIITGNGAPLDEPFRKANVTE